MGVLQCPSCGKQLVADKNNPSRVLCYHCKKSYDAAKVERHWERKRLKSEQAAVARQDAAPAINPRIDTEIQSSPEPVPDRVPDMARPAVREPAPVETETTSPRPARPSVKDANGKRTSGRMNDVFSTVSLLAGIAALAICLLPAPNVMAIPFAIASLAGGLAVLSIRGTKFPVLAIGAVGGACAVLAIAVLIGQVVSPPASSAPDTAANANTSEPVASETAAPAEPQPQPSAESPQASPERVSEQGGIPESMLGIEGSSAGAWKDCSLKFDGQDVKLYEMTLGDVMARCGLVAEKGYSTDKVLDPGHDDYIFAVDPKYPNIMVVFDVDNVSDSSKPMSECALASMLVETVDGSGQGAPAIELPGGVRYGMPVDEVVGIYGTPSDVQVPSVPQLFSFVLQYSDGEMFAPVRLTFSNDGGTERLSAISVESPRLWQ